MVERFNALADRGNFEFEAWFNDRIEPGRSWEVDESSWRFKYKYIPSSELMGNKFRWPWPILKCTPDVMISLYAEPVFLFGFMIAKLHGIKTGFWVEVTFDSWVKRRRWKEALKRLIFPRANIIVTVGEDGRQYALRYGARPDSVKYAPHVIDVNHFAQKAKAGLHQREKLRSRLGLVGVTFMYVGRLLCRQKGLDDLLQAYAIVQSRFKEEVSLVLVGDGEDQEYLHRRSKEMKLANVVFTGFIHKNDLPLYYVASDVFVFPTLGDPYGLVVDEAMACSLPVISTNAAGEIRKRIEHGVNGYIVPPENSAVLAEKMLILAQNAKLRKTMGMRSYKKIKNNTPEKWAEDFEHIIFNQVTGKYGERKYK